MTHRTELGRRGEALAAAHLEAVGFTIVDRNWRCAQGEIDIVARAPGARVELVFVEVKTRSSVAFRHPFEAITAVKLARMRRLAAAWCSSHTDVGGSIRLDAVAVLAPPGGPVELEHLERVH